MPKATKTPRPSAGTEQFLLCPEVLSDSAHQVFLEVVACRGGRSHTIYCPECGSRLFMGPRSKWAKGALTRAQVEAQTHYKSVYPAVGP